MADLAERECVPCRGGVPALRGEAISALQSQLAGWEVVNEPLGWRHVPKHPDALQLRARGER